MFKELAPLLATRSFLLTLSKEDASDNIIVTVAPMLKENDSNALSQAAFNVAGTAEALDAELAPKLAAYAVEFMTLDGAIAALQANTAAALAEAKAESEKKIAEAKKSKTATTPKPSDIKPKPAPVAPPPPPSLFDSPNPTPAPPVAPAPVAEETDDEDEGEDEDDDEGTDEATETASVSAPITMPSSQAHSTTTTSASLFSSEDIEAEILEEVSSGRNDYPAAA